MTVRRLAAILAADVVGFSSLMGQDEEGTLELIKGLRRDVIEPKVKDHHGRVFKTTGDGFLVEFQSPVEAVRCAVAVQEGLATQAAQEPSRGLQLRVGINLGDILIEEDGDVYGDGVNVAARLEQLADPGGIAVSGKIYEEVRDKLPYSFEDRGEQHVKNIARPVRVFSFVTGGRAAERSTSLSIPDKPSIAVLPFNNLGASGEDDYLADGIVEDIIAALSRVRSFFVIARNSTFTYKGRAVNVQQVSRELGVRYVLEGSVRRGGDRVRVTSQLVDATTGAHLWADHYDGTTEDVFDLQDRITASVVGAIQPSIRGAEIERATRKRPDSLDAYDLVMRALPDVWSMEETSNTAAIALLDRALRLDPNYTMALALSSWCSGQRVVYNWSRDIDKDRNEAVTKAKAAAALAPDDPFVLTALGAGLTISREFNAAVHAIEKALSLDANSAWTWNRSGWLKIYLDDPETSIDHFNRAIRLSPFDPMIASGYAGIAAAHFAAGRYETAVEWFEKAVHANPRAVWIYRGYAAALGSTGRQREAETYVRKLLDFYPDVNIRTLQASLPFSAEFLSRYLEGLRRAGLPE
jgi:adenylate cyclase